jgi:arabinose-5-phosphate isomerase
MSKPLSTERPTDERARALIASAIRTLEAEAGGITTLATAIHDGLGRAFIAAADMISGAHGRLIVTGMGKSGHVGRKIAATFASTGTPAFFVHPGEASHGDLGMIMQDDIVIALSNSGETAELTDLVAYTRRFSIPLIAITARAGSALDTAADITLQLPKVPEVCPMGLAPTTSTTMMLAMGDALAVAALECKGFTADDFRNFHPGGKIGKILLRTSEVMHSGADLPLAQEADTMNHVLVVMTEKSFGCAGIVDASGRLTGIITDGDLRRHMQGDLLSKKAADIMTKGPQTITPQTLAAEALKILNDKKRTQLFVVDGEKPVGILHIHDLLRAGIA